MKNEAKVVAIAVEAPNVKLNVVICAGAAGAIAYGAVLILEVLVKLV